MNPTHVFHCGDRLRASLIDQVQGSNVLFSVCALNSISLILYFHSHREEMRLFVRFRSDKSKALKG